MKNYIFKTTTVKKRTYLEWTLSIYKIVKNTPIYLGERVCNSSSCTGQQSEVLKFLFHKGEVSKRYFEKYDGYYVFNSESKIRITEIN